MNKNKPIPISDTEVEERPATRVLVNGAVYDDTSKRIVKGATLSSDQAREMVRAREEKRMRLYAEGAALAVEDSHLIRAYGEDAHIVARARTLQQIAETPDAGKAAVMAAQYLDKAQGYTTDNKQGGGGGGMNQSDAVDLLMAVGQMARDIAQAKQDVTPIRSDDDES